MTLATVVAAGVLLITVIISCFLALLRQLIIPVLGRLVIEIILYYLSVCLCYVSLDTRSPAFGGPTARG